MKHRVTTDDAGLRCDVIAARVSGAPRSVVAEAAHNGRLLLNAQAVKGSALASEGDELEFALRPRVALRAFPEHIALDILFEDDALLVVNKPPGMVTHPAHGAKSGTLVNALLAHTPLPGEELRAGLVHRLDRDTSGLLVVAKTPEALRALGIAMSRRYVEREYCGLVRGIPIPARGTLDGPIARDPANRLKFAVRSDGKPAVTHYEVRERLRDASEVEFRLETGRTHQIRVHFASFGYPLLNDPLYGRRDPRIALPGQALHARRLRFRHPLTREPLAFEVAPPPQYLEALQTLRE